MMATHGQPRCSYVVHHGEATPHCHQSRRPRQVWKPLPPPRARRCHHHHHCDTPTQDRREDNHAATCRLATTVQPLGQTEPTWVSSPVRSSTGRVKHARTGARRRVLGQAWLENQRRLCPSPSPCPSPSCCDCVWRSSSSCQSAGGVVDNFWSRQGRYTRYATTPGATMRGAWQG